MLHHKILHLKNDEQNQNNKHFLIAKCYTVQFMYHDYKL